MAIPFAKVSDISRTIASGSVLISSAPNYISTQTAANLGATPFPAGTIVFAKIGEAIRLNNRAITTRAMLFDNNVMGVTPRTTLVDLEYLYYFLQTLDLYKLANVTAVPALRKTDLAEIEVPLPPLSEQKRAANLLGEAKRLRRMCRSALQMCDELLPAVFLETFGDPLTNPKGWEQCLIDDVLEWSQYGTSQKSTSAKRGYPILGMTNITGEGRVVMLPLSYVDLPADEFRTLRLDRGDIIFNRTNSTELVGKTACWRLPINAVIASYLVRLRLKPSADPEFFSALLNTGHYKKLFQSRCKTAVGQSNISPTLLREFPIYLPPLDLQRRFVSFVSRLERFRVTYVEGLRQADHLFQTLLHQAFSSQ